MFKLVLRNKVKFPLKPEKRETSDVPHQTPLSWTENISSVLSLSSPGNSSKNRKFHKHFPVPGKSSNTVLSLNADVLIHRVPPELKRTGFRGYLVPGKRRTFRWKQRGRPGCQNQQQSSFCSQTGEPDWVENSRSHRLQGERVPPCGSKDAIQGGKAFQMKTQTSTFRSSGCLAPSLTLNRGWVLLKSRPEQQPPRRARWSAGLGGIPFQPQEQGHRAWCGAALIVSCAQKARS